HGFPSRDPQRSDRKLDLENDPYALSSVTPPRFRNPREAAEYLTLQRAAPQQEAEQVGIKQLRDNREEWERRKSYATTYSSDEDKAFLARLSEDAQKLHDDQGQTVRGAQAVDARLGQLRAEGKFAEADALYQAALPIAHERVRQHNQEELRIQQQFAQR